MNWIDERPAPVSLDEGREMFRGALRLLNDKAERLANIVWFCDDGPFYAYAVDASDLTMMRRIGPHTSIDSAKQACIDVIEGRRSIRARAAYPRHPGGGA